MKKLGWRRGGLSAEREKEDGGGPDVGAIGKSSALLLTNKREIFLNIR